MPTVVGGPYPFPVKYSFYRLNVSANNGQSRTEAAEIRLREVSGGVNLMPTFLAAATDSLSSGTAGNAFDNSTGTLWVINATNGWVQAELTVPKVVKEYTVVGTGTQGGNRNAQAWTFEGSKDGVDWVVLDTVTGQTGWSAGQERVFTL